VTAIHQVVATGASRPRDGLRAAVTGDAAVTADSGSTTLNALLLSTVVIVAVILLLVYRSPVLWLLPFPSPTSHRHHHRRARPTCSPAVPGRPGTSTPATPRTTASTKPPTWWRCCDRDPASSIRRMVSGTHMSRTRTSVRRHCAGGAEGPRHLPIFVTNILLASLSGRGTLRRLIPLLLSCRCGTNRKCRVDYFPAKGDSDPVTFARTSWHGR
jgi:MMPL family